VQPLNGRASPLRLKNPEVDHLAATEYVHRAGVDIASKTSERESELLKVRGTDLIIQAVVA